MYFYNLTIAEGIMAMSQNFVSNTAEILLFVIAQLLYNIKFQFLKKKDY